VIGVETAQTVFEQDKYSLRSDSPPFGDRAKGLWNTIAIWMDAVESGEYPIERTSFLMVTNTTVGDCIARQIALAKTSNPDANLDALVARRLDELFRRQSRRFTNIGSDPFI